MAERRTLVFLALMSVAVLGGWVIAASPLFVLGLGATHRGIDPVKIVGFTGTTALAVAWGFYFAGLAHNRLDEFQIERTRSATYWGTALGVAVSAPIFVFISFGGLHWINARFPMGKDLAAAFDYGYGLAIVSIGLCCLGADAWRRLFRR